MNNSFGAPGSIPGEERSQGAIDANPPVSTIAFVPLHPCKKALNLFDPP
jgi:hypothetical protein